MTYCRRSQGGAGADAVEYEESRLSRKPFGTFKALIPNKTIRGSTNTYWDAATQNGKARSEEELVRLEIGGDCCNPQ